MELIVVEFKDGAEVSRRSLADIPIGETATLGRASSCSLQIGASCSDVFALGISRLQATIQRTGESEYYLLDGDGVNLSETGIWVGGESSRLPPRTAIAPGIVYIVFGTSGMSVPKCQVTIELTHSTSSQTFLDTQSSGEQAILHQILGLVEATSTGLDRFQHEQEAVNSQSKEALDSIAAQVSSLSGEVGDLQDQTKALRAHDRKASASTQATMQKWGTGIAVLALGGFFAGKQVNSDSIAQLSSSIAMISGAIAGTSRVVSGSNSEEDDEELSERGRSRG